MKASFFTLLCLLTSLSIFSQSRNELKHSLQYIPCDYLIVGTSATFYHQFVPKAVFGVKLGIATDAFGVENGDSKIYALNFDVVKHWTFASNQKDRFFLDLGISAMQVMEIFPASSFGIDCVVGMSPEQIKKLTETTFNNRSDFSYYPGVAISFGFDHRVGQRFHIGLELLLNTYYDDCERVVYPYPKPAITGSYSF